MVKPVAKAEINSFIGGLITEASPLNFPPNASVDEENFNLNTDGTRDRRFGFDFEPNYSIRSTGYSELQLESKATSSYKWFNANNDPLNEFVVVQFGSILNFFNSNTASISGDGFLGTVTLTGIDPAVRCSYASVDGLLIIAAATEVIHIISWNGTTFSYTRSRLQVRDFWGLPGYSGNNENFRPTTGSTAHIYNLRNQGWGIPRKNSTGTLDDPVSIFYGTYNKFPSNADVVYTGLQFQPVSSGVPFERIYPSFYDDILGLDLPAAKGYFIIDALARGTSRQSAYSSNMSKFPQLTYSIGTLPQDTTTKGASCVADFAGRVFFAGFGGDVTGGDANSPSLSNYVLFSQLVKAKEDIIKCYQRGDPTSRENSDLIDTDGGYLRVSGAKKIISMVSIFGSLVVIADNGVWQIVGGSDTGFTATNFSVKKLSTYGGINANSVISVNDSVYYWGEAGIYIVQRNEFGDLVVSNITERTIQKYYNELESLDKEKAFGIFDPFDRKVRWIYNQDVDRDNNNIVRELIFDTVIGSFSKVRIYNLAEGTPEIIGLVSTATFTSGMGELEVVSSAGNVQVGGENVVIQSLNRNSIIQSVKYITLYGMVGSNIGFTFSQEINESFKDWESVDGEGVDAFAYIMTGSNTGGDSSSAKQTPYLTMHFRKTEDGVETVDGELVPANRSSCLIRSQWDWANTVNSKKWGPLTQAYRYRKPLFITSPTDEYDNGFEVVTSKNKLRGRGKAFSLFIQTEPERDCRILGWSLQATGNPL
jgi:hypothetical protein